MQTTYSIYCICIYQEPAKCPDAKGVPLFFPDYVSSVYDDDHLKTEEL